MILAVALTFISLFIVFDAVKMEPFSPGAIKQNPHAVVGSVCIICCAIQPFMALFRFVWTFKTRNYFTHNFQQIQNS